MMEKYSDYGRPVSGATALDVPPLGLVSIPPNTVLIIPIGTPAPEQLAKVAVTGNTLYERLAPLCVEEPLKITLTFLSGAELESLTKTWVRLVLAKNIRTVSMLPGQVSDPLFSLGADNVGIRAITWPEIEHQLVTQSRLEQSHADRDSHRHVGPPKEAEIVEGVPEASEPLTRGPRGWAGKAPQREQMRDEEPQVRFAPTPFPDTADRCVRTARDDDSGYGS